MSLIVQKFLTAAITYFVVGLLLQVVVLADVWWGFNPLAYTSVGITEQALFFGWLSQVVLALVYDRWLPTPQFGLLIYRLFNFGLPLTILGQPILTLTGANWLGLLIVIGGILQLIAGGLVVWEIRQRLVDLSA